MFSQTAYAAGGRQAETHKVAFNHASIDPLRSLDWRSPSAELTFDIPDNDWVDEIELLLSARPNGRVSAATPLMVRFNDAPPIPVNTDGYGFDARINLEPRHMRGQRNIISIEYGVPQGDACLSAAHGVWDLDISESFVVVRSRSKLQAQNFHDVRARLTSSATAPKSVSILAKGADAIKLEALAAQGISRNLPEIPHFRLGSQSADMTIVAARRDNLGRWVSDPAIRKGKGAQIAVSSSRPLKLVLTGDSDAEVMAAAKAFASANIPDFRARDLSPARFQSAGDSLAAPKRVSGTVSLVSLGAAPFSAGWAPRPQHIIFDVIDPAASSGQLDLHLQSGPFIDPASRLDVSLNGKTLDSAALSKSKSRIKIDIPQGLLRGLNNRLVFTPRLTPSSAQPACAATRIGPGLGLDAKSNLTISRDGLSDKADLSAFAASGAPFSGHGGEAATVILATSSRAERAAALRVIARLARASHRGWTEAKIIAATDTAWPEYGHILVIGSNIDLDEPALSAAPRSLKTAMTGTRYHDPVVTKSAALSAVQPVLLSARDSVRGGVAAIYQRREDQLVGIITQTRQQSFTKAVDNLLDGEHWNALQGSVARWDEAKVSMAQTALPPKPLKTRKILNFDGPKWGKVEGFKTSMGDKWDALISAAKRAWDKPESSPSLPPQAGLTPFKALVPTPRLKPSRAIAARPAPASSMPMKIGSRSVAVPKAPREDIFPKIDELTAQLGAKFGTGYEALSQRLSGAVKATPLGEHPASDSASPKLLIFAIVIIALLLLTVFVSPGKSRSGSSGDFS